MCTYADMHKSVDLLIFVVFAHFRGFCSFSWFCMNMHIYIYLYMYIYTYVYMCGYA